MASKVNIEFCNIVDTDDLVELHIIEQLQKLQYQNKRLLEHIDQTNTWAALKKMEDWKPFDFYHYFCTRYEEICRKQYKAEQNLTRVYRRIEEFIKVNKVTNKDFKKFIDLAFERFFNAVNAPHIGHICSPNLFSHLMHRPARLTTQNEYFQLDQQLETENEQFEKYVKSNELCEYGRAAARY
jgi:hypothetical protein